LFELWKYEVVRIAAGVMAGVLVVKLAYALYCWRRLTAAGIDRIDTMSGLEFEQYLERLFSRLGYQVERTQYSGDFGADLIVARKDERCVIQAKRMSSSVGVAAIQQAVAACAMYDCDYAMVVTNNRFTRQAEALAAANDVELWDRERLIEEALHASARRSVALRPVREKPFAELAEELPPAEAVTAPVATSVVCRSCGRAVSAAMQEYCLANERQLGGQFYCNAHYRRGSGPRARSSVPRSRSG
jgi:hypothetical protein